MVLAPSALIASMCYSRARSARRRRMTMVLPPTCTIGSESSARRAASMSVRDARSGHVCARFDGVRARVSTTSVSGAELRSLISRYPLPRYARPGALLSFAAVAAAAWLPRRRVQQQLRRGGCCRGGGRGGCGGGCG